MRAKLLTLLAVIALCMTSVAPVVAKGPPPGSGGGNGMGQGHRITNAERKAAAIRIAKQRHAKGGAAALAIPGTNTVMLGVTGAPGEPTGNGANAALATPDYWGSIPNYANSPLPTSVSIQGDGYDAFATATVDPTTGSVTGFTVVNGGSSYSFADVVVIGGGGSGAVGAATIDPLTGAITGIVVATDPNSGALLSGSGYGTMPGIRKFVDALPGLDPTAPNDLGQYIPIAVADTTSFPGNGANVPAADFYEIAVIQYTQKLHSDLPATTLRGYVQIETPSNVGVSKHVPLFYPDGSPIMANGTQVLAVDDPQYLGPLVVANQDRPVRVKFDNYLPAGTGGDLFLPVDPTIMGAGTGPTSGVYSQDRATLHLHGGVTPWISDGTQDQWTTPTGATEAYPKGVSTGYVPDMWYDAAGNDIPACDGFTTCDTVAHPGATNNPGAGHMTFYYTNQQSARLMFYHDHAYGITRLNVYAGEAAGYLLNDPVEQGLVSNGTIPAAQVPLVIQDKTFVPSPTQLAAEDPTWNTTFYGGYGSLWFPHVYMTNQNPGDASGANAMGRWDYGPWFWPSFQTTHPTVNNPLCDFTNPAAPVCPVGENPFNPGVPNPSIVPESFMDTMMVNGTVYPFVQLQPQAYRLRILNASNDRTLNLSLFKAGTSTAAGFTPCTGTVWSGTTLNNNGCAGEVPMVPAVKGGYGTTGYTYPDQLDGRNGGVPDSRAAGPSMIQIGTEGGFLSKPAVIKNGPVGYNYNRRDIVVLNVSNKSLTLGPAERADVIVDLSGVPAGTNLIMYNDSPAPMPAFDSRYDYYTGDPDQVMNGGAPTTQPGYGPNSRTVMQIQVGSTVGAGANLAALNAAIPTAYGQTQAAPVVPEQGYDQAFNSAFGLNNTSPADPYIRIQNTTGTTFQNGSVTGFTITNAGSGYTSPPTVTLSGGGGSGAVAQAILSGGGVASLTLAPPNFGGSGYTSPPTVTLSAPDIPPGIQATATATLSTTVAAATIDPNGGGSGYTDAPGVTFSGGGATTNATGTAVLTPSGVGAVNVSNGGSYTTPPSVIFTPTGASGTAVLGNAPVTAVNLTNSGGLYTSPPTVTFNGVTTGATATATLAPTGVASLTLNPGSTPYISAPTVTFSSGTAAATANLAATGSVGAVNVATGGSGYTLPPTVSLGAPQTAGGTQATAAVTAMSPTGVGSVTMVNRGSCTSTTPFQVTFTPANGGPGSGALGTANIGGNPRRVQGVTMTAAGSGYVLPPTPNFSAGTNCTGETGTTRLVATSVLTIGVGSPGSGYTSAPRVSFNGGGGGTGATANAVLGRMVASFTITSSGSVPGYTVAPTVTINGPQFTGGVQATATVNLAPTPIASIAVNTGGSYAPAPAAPPTVGFTGGGQSVAATAVAVLGPSAVVSVAASGGTYTAAPAVTFSSGVATATAALVPTSVASIVLSAPNLGGAGYNTAPSVTIAAPQTAGTTATATATLTPAPVNALEITNVGSGYTTDPSVVISDPPVGGTTATAVATHGPLTLSGFTITNPGAGYVASPTVTLSAPQTVGGVQAAATAAITTAPITLALQPKGIQELFEPDYGRMNATMSVEIPNTNGTNQTTIPYGNIDPPTEIVDTSGTNAVPTVAGGTVLAMLPDGTQIWKFTHNGVDTHSVHFHMFNIQLINRVGWDGAIRPPDANEMGWKDTVRMSPLEDALVAIKPIVPVLPWPLPNSVRPLSPADPLGAPGNYTNIDPNGNPNVPVITNHLVNFGWEYVFHCHLLGHEENDMMRPVAVGIAPVAPSGVSAASDVSGVVVSFTDNSPNETSFTLQRFDGTAWADAGTLARTTTWDPATQSVTDTGRAFGVTESITDTAVLTSGVTYQYRVIAHDLIGDTVSTDNFPNMSIDSIPSDVASFLAP